MSEANSMSSSKLLLSFFYTPKTYLLCIYYTINKIDFSKEKRTVEIAIAPLREVSFSLSDDKN